MTSRGQKGWRPVTTDVVELLDAVDRAVAAAVGVVSEESAARAAARAAELRRRRGFQGQTLVLAIAGGTGTGKSSLLNAIAREPVASVSRIRPHTDRPLAWVPAGPSPGLDDLFGDLGIMDSVPQTRWPDLALIDLPDMDSIADQHRRTVEDLIPRVDGVMWVLDPSKYGDPTLHSGFLRPLEEYRDQFVFVLNKIDTLGPSQRATVAEDVRRRLVADGYPDPHLFLTAVAPTTGVTEGLSELEAYLATLLETKRTAVSKWLIDIGRELRALGEEAGVWAGASVDLHARWTRDRDAAVAGILPGRGPGSRSDALCRLEDLVAMVAVEVGPRIGSTIRDRFPEGAVETVLDAAARDAAQAAAGTRRKRRSTEAAMNAARAELDQQIGDPLRVVLGGRARFGATLAEAGVGVAEVEAELATAAGS